MKGCVVWGVGRTKWKQILLHVCASSLPTSSFQYHLFQNVSAGRTEQGPGSIKGSGGNLAFNPHPHVSRARDSYEENIPSAAFSRPIIHRMIHLTFVKGEKSIIKVATNTGESCLFSENSSPPLPFLSSPASHSSPRAPFP